jgi:hypothetical protein
MLTAAFVELAVPAGFARLISSFSARATAVSEPSSGIHARRATGGGGAGGSGFCATSGAGGGALAQAPDRQSSGVSPNSPNRLGQMRRPVSDILN